MPRFRQWRLIALSLTPNCFPSLIAADARRIIEQGEYTKAQKQATEIAKLIKDALAEGNRSMYYYNSLEASVKAKLEKDGYTVKQDDSWRDGVTVTISF